MRVAIPAKSGSVFGHLGRAPVFVIAEVENGQIVRREEVRNPGHGPGTSPAHFLAHQGLTHIIACGMGDHALETFRYHGIEVIRGIEGPVEEVLAQFAAGTLRSNPDNPNCAHDHHHHHDHHHGHHHHH